MNYRGHLNYKALFLGFAQEFDHESTTDENSKEEKPLFLCSRLRKGGWRMCLCRRSLLLAVRLLVGLGVAVALLPALPCEHAARGGPAQPDRAQIAALLERLLGEDVEEYLEARRRLLGAGRRCRVALEEAEKRLVQRGDRRNLLRVRTLLRELTREEQLRVVETAMARAARLAAAGGRRKAAPVIVLLHRDFCERLGDFRSPDDYAGMCYYSFPKSAHGYEGQASLEYGGPGDQFLVQMYGGQESGLTDLGPVDFKDVTTAPNDLKGKGRTGLQAVVGHVYVEHHLEGKDEDLGGFKFEVLDLEPGRWLVLAWERVPLEKGANAKP
jgi:hypothetical protein